MFRAMFFDSPPTDIVRSGVFVDHYNQVWRKQTVNGGSWSLYLSLEFDVVDKPCSAGCTDRSFHTEGAEDLVRLVGVFDDGSVISDQLSRVRRTAR